MMSIRDLDQQLTHWPQIYDLYNQLGTPCTSIISWKSEKTVSVVVITCSYACYQP